MDEYSEHKSFDEALKSFKKEHPDCQIESFSGNTQQIIDGFGIKGYPIPRDKTIPSYLIKVGKEEHMLPLLKQGYVYMNPTSYFKNLEYTGDGRADDGEGAHSIVQTGGLIINGLEVKISTPLTFSVPGHNSGYIYCMIGVYNDTRPQELLNERMIEMGTVAIIIHEPEQFIQRCAAVLKANNHTLEWGRVRYYDKAEGSYLLDPWLKTKEYEYQSEFRLFFPMKETKAKVLQLGSTEDIAQAFSIFTKKME